MTAITPPRGNRIVTPPSEPQSFPTIMLLGLIVASGIYIVNEFDSRAAWLLAFLVLLGIAFRYQSFGSELTSLLGATASDQQTNVPSGQLMPGQQGPLPIDYISGQPR